MKQRIFLGGANRGGKAITETALREAGAYGAIVIADPKEDRASQLARSWREKGIRAEGLKEPCEEAIDKMDANVLMLAIDTISPMAKILEKKPLPTQWQLLARGLGADGPVVGLAGTVTEGDKESRIASVRLINVLGSFIEPQSSKGIRENPLNADRLYIMRRKVSEHSVNRLKVLGREPEDIKGGTLNFLWWQRMYPMVIQSKGGSWRETTGQVVEAELPAKTGNDSAYVVAAVGQREADFFFVEPYRGRRIIKFHMPLVHSLPTVAGDEKTSSGLFGGFFAGLGLLGVAAQVAAAAMVTD